MGVKGADKKRKDDMRERVGVKECFKKKLTRSKLKLAGHVEGMGNEKLANRADVQKVEGKGGEED